MSQTTQNSNQTESSDNQQKNQSKNQQTTPQTNQDQTPTEPQGHQINSEQLAEYQKFKDQAELNRQALENKANQSQTALDKEMSDLKKLVKSQETELKLANSKALLDGKYFNETELDGYDSNQIKAMNDLLDKFNSSKTGKIPAQAVARTGEPTDSKSGSNVSQWNAKEGKFQDYYS